MDTNYQIIPGLEHIYLEDSWILRTDESVDGISFALEAVLTEEHPDYEPPKPGEQYCYRSAILAFSNASKLDWCDKNFAAVTRDSDGSVDHGNIETLAITATGYYVEGNFGKLTITSVSPPNLTLL